MDKQKAIDSLLIKAVEARERAYAPFSGFRVGAALLGASGTIYTGCNVENSSYGLSICAERTALFKAVSEGEKEFECVAVVTDRELPVSPCGACCQVLAEFNPDLMVIMANTEGTKKIQPLSKLFSRPFHIDARSKNKL